MGTRQIAMGETVRRAARRTVEGAARLKPNSWSSVEVRMKDLSELGFRAACEARVPVGGCVSLDVAGVGPVEAQVEWQRGGEFGARFLLPLPLDRCEWILDSEETPLASLLFQRAAAHRTGRHGADEQLRRHILAALPIRKGDLTGC